MSDIVTFYNIYNYPDFPLKLTIDKKLNKFDLKYGCGQTVYESNGNCILDNNIMKLNNNIYLLIELKKPIMYFTGYQFIYSEKVFNITNVESSESTILNVDELVQDYLEIPIDIDDLKFLNEMGFSCGRWIKYKDIDITNIENVTRENFQTYFHEIIVVYHRYPKTWNEFKKFKYPVACSYP